MKNNFFDIPQKFQIGFQDPATPIMEGIIDLHHNIFFYLLIIIGLVLWVLSQIYFYFNHIWDYPKNKRQINARHYFYKYTSRLFHGTWLEIIWTLTPSIILMLIAIPSFVLLYAIEELIDPLITIKIIGSQWYWNYEYSDYFREIGDISFDSYMIQTDELQKGDLRLLEVDNPIYVPVNTHVRLIITATDVLHSWAVPSLGIKVDAVPGRLNQVSLYLKREGTFYGQCSELCGVNHGFMPIVVKGVTYDNYYNWLLNFTK
jgi:cytochrome c oxidase subunit 2